MPTTFIPESVSERVTEGLDRLEAALPAIPARVLRLQRTIATANCERISEFWSSVSDNTKSFLDSARVSGKTVTGQARAAAEDVARTTRENVSSVADHARSAGADVTKAVRDNARTVSGQAEAQGRRVADSVEKSAEKVLDDAIDAAEGPGTGTPYEQWTKAQLLARAKRLGIDGRATMSKKDLITALRS